MHIEILSTSLLKVFVYNVFTYIGKYVSYSSFGIMGYLIKLE